MEKFSVDLNTVLGEFDFNQDPSQSITQNPVACNNPVTPNQVGLSDVQGACSNVLSDNKKYSLSENNSSEINLLLDCDSIVSNIDSICKPDVSRVDSSINHFYPHRNVEEDKVQSKLTNFQGSESTSLTIHNDISKNFLQKIQNDDVAGNQTNFHQSNFIPSTSNLNVLNSFTDFSDNAQPSNSKNISSTSNLTPSETNYSLLDDPVNCSTDLLSLNPYDELINPTPTKSGSNESNVNIIPPKYQNILLPVKLENQPLDKINTTINTSYKDINFTTLTADKIPIDNFNDKTERPFKSLIDEPEHVYENVYIGTNIPKSQETYSVLSKVSNLTKHTYENVDLLSKNISMPSQSNVFDSTGTSNLEELNINCTKKEDIKNILQGNEISSYQQTSDVSTRLIFENVHLNNPPLIEPKPVVFKIIDDMSEQELNKYLADLEAAEKAKELSSALYENISSTNFEKSLSNMKTSSEFRENDEDANEAPIFESVTIGEIPKISDEDLQEKAKKFPIIDYGSASTTSSSKESINSGLNKSFEGMKITTEVINNDLKGKSKKIHEKVRKSSDNAGNTSETTNCTEKFDKDENDEKNGNYLLTEENVSIYNCIEETNDTVTTDEMNSNNDDLTVNSSQDKNDKINENQNESSLENISHEVGVTQTETISRFSVATNVNINDELGSKCKPLSSSTRRKPVEKNLDNAELDENDVNKPSRPQTLNVVSNISASENSCSELEDDRNSGRGPSPDVSENSSIDSGLLLGKQPPFWVPDSDAPNCMLCDVKFTVMKRRHHCRACGKVLCNKCCNMKYRLEYQSNIESRVCILCYQVLTKAESESGSGDWAGFSHLCSSSGINSPQGKRKPDPHNPMEYCSTIPPLQQLAGSLPPPPTVMVPVGVLKREGSSKQRADGPKSVMFSDGIRPGCDLTELDTTWDWKAPSFRKTGSTKSVAETSYRGSGMLSSRDHNVYPTDSITNSYIPHETSKLPPTVTFYKGQITYHEVTDFANLHSSLQNECEPPTTFAINRNLYAHVKIINLDCCVNKICWAISSKGLACVGQDEVVFLVEVLPKEKDIPKDLLLHINQIYLEALKGNTISEFSLSIHQNGDLLDSREHAGFLFIRQTLQCLQKITLPPAPYLFGLLVHRWETPWAKVFPLRLVLRLGAEYRYYPSPLVSVRFRNAVYFEIGHTIMKVLADFRNFAYTIPKVQGLTIHVQDRVTYVRFPKNRYNQVIKGLNNSNDHVLAFAANFSIQADSHLVCIQSNSEEESSYQTQAINIQNKPRIVTGASFIVINGALKSSMGLSAKSSILEDGLMVQIMPEKMEALKAALKNMQDFTVGCGRQGAPEPDEVVNITWTENDTQFNLGVKSPIDGKMMDGIPSIRVHNGVKCIGTHRLIRWTEVFIIKLDDDQPFGIQCPIDVNKLSENIARATCAALVKLLDLLANAGLTKIAVRTTIHPDDVGYEAGSEGMRLPPLYMKSLDNELIKVLQKAVQGCEDTYTVLELIFYILETEKMC